MGIDLLKICKEYVAHLGNIFLNAIILGAAENFVKSQKLNCFLVILCSKWEENLGVNFVICFQWALFMQKTTEKISKDFVRTIEHCFC